MSLRPQRVAAIVPTWGNGYLAATPQCGSQPNLACRLEMAIVPAAGRSGARYLDLSGRRRHANTNGLSFCSGLQYVWGPHGCAYLGRGANSDAAMVLAPIPTMTTAAIPWTVSVIARQVTAAAAERGIVITPFGGLCWDTSRNGFYVYRDGVASNAAQYATSVDATLWHHYVATFNGSGTTPQLWVDGVRGESTYSGSVTTGTVWRVGRSNLNGWANLYVHGLWIWSRRLGDAEVLDHFGDPYGMHRRRTPLGRLCAPAPGGGGGSFQPAWAAGHSRLISLAC